MKFNEIIRESDEDKPPSEVCKGNLDIGSGNIFALSALVKRFKGIGELWESDWDICPVRGIISSRRFLIFENIQRR